MSARRVVVLVAILVAPPGCTVKVDFGCEDSEGTRYATAESFENGCETCTCGADGTLSCDSSRCVGGCKTDRGETVAIGDTVDMGDGCNVCVCNQDGFVCSGASSCDGCLDKPPICDVSTKDPTGCHQEPVCGPTGDWYCSLVCDCDGQQVPECPAPPGGCYYDGPACDQGIWSCGNLVCDPCSGPAPTCDPVEPGCDVSLYCTDIGWQCETVCNCTDPPPECDPDSFAECSPEVGWICQPINTTCPFGGMVDCGPSPDPVCSYYPTCHEDTTWWCQLDCPHDLCAGPPPDDQCIVQNPACVGFAVCDTMQQGWVCAEQCL